jgi:pimeloyl-ACP methyl ester carboxylesterase
VNLLTLGTAQRRLFAIHEAAAPTPRPRAAVICQPLGTEYTYAHRSVRHLATRLTMSGFHIIRFDYFGTGDSAGTDSEVDLVGCQTDAESAIEALLDIAGTPRVTLIGLRAGANIAAHVAARRIVDVESLVLWDPIPSGDLPALADATRQHTAIFVSDSAQACDTLRPTGLTTEFVPTQCPWVESATTSGMLPMAVIQRIVEWLQ